MWSEEEEEMAKRIACYVRMDEWIADEENKFDNIIYQVFLHLK